MASTVTSREHTGDGSDKTWAYTFQSYQQEDIKVAITNAAGLFKNVTNFTIPDYSTASGTVTFNNTGVDSDVCESDGSPKTGRIIRIFRETDITTGSVGEYDPKATYTAGSAVKAGDLNNNAKQALYAAFEVRDQEIQRADIRNDSIDGTKIDDDSIDSEHYVAGSIDLEHMSANSVDSDQYVDGSIDLAHMSANSVDSDQYVDGSIDRVHLAADIVDGTKIADDSINSEHYVDGSIDTAHIADLQVTGAKIANDTITNAKIVNQTISNSKLVPNSITASELASGSVGTDELIDDAVTNDKILNRTIANNKLVENSITASELAASSVATSELANNAVTNDKILNRTIANDKLVLNSVTASELADNAVGTDEIADNAVTVAKIADGELSTLASMQSGTASKLADSTALTADIADLNQIDGLAKQTTITDDDAKFPTSGAVVDYVAAQILPIGGLEVIANDASFPNTQALSGVVISIADAGGLEVNGSGSSTTARTVGGSTVTINNINSAYNSSTVENGVGFLVSSTGSGQIYNYHKSIIRDQDIISISSDINDFGNRYRVGSSNPSSSNDAGDLFFNTTSSKLLVYNGSTSAWEEAQSVGNFYINTISSYSGTGGNSASFNGSAYRFVLSNAGTHAQQHIVSINGVIQKPNSGTSQPSEGFVIDGSSIIFSNAPATGSDYFIVTVGAAVNIGSPGDNAVATISLQNASVTTAKIAADAVDGTKIADNAIDSEHYTDGSIDLAHMSANSVDSDQYVDGSIDTAHIAADQITGALIADDAVGAEHIEVLDANLQLADNAKIQVGTGNDLQIYFDGTNSYIDHGASTGELQLRLNAWPSQEKGIVLTPNGTVELYHDHGKKIETTSYGVAISTKALISGANGTDYSLILEPGTAGTPYGIWVKEPASPGNGYPLLNISDNSGTAHFRVDSGTGAITIPKDNKKLKIGAGNDLQIYHDGTDSHIDNSTGGLAIKDTGGYMRLKSNDLKLESATDEDYIACTANGAVELYYDNSKKLETTSAGVKISGSGADAVELEGDVWFNNNEHAGADIYFNSGDKHLIFEDNVIAKFGGGGDLQIYHNGSESVIKDAGTGALVLLSNDLQILNAASNEYMIRATEDAGVKLYYDNNLKFETNSDGTRFYGRAYFDDDMKIEMGAAADLKMYHDGTDSWLVNSTGKFIIKESGGGNLELRGDDVHILNEAGSETMAKFIEDGAVELYCNNVKSAESGTTGWHVYGSDNRLVFADDSNTWISRPQGDSIDIVTGGTQRMYLTSGGQVHVGDFDAGTIDDFDERLIVQTRSASGYGIAIRHRWDSAGSMMRFGTWNSSSNAEQVCGEITGSDTSTTYGTSSDYRLKENNVAISDGITRLKLLKPYRFNWKADPDTTVDGFFAHEVTPAIPEAVTGEKDGPIDEIGSGYQMIDFGKMVPLLTAALQEAITEIETLKTKVAALEAK